MMNASSVLLDSARLAALRHAVRSDAAARATFERLALLAARTLRTPVAQVNFVSSDAQISLSSVGPDPWSGPRETPLERSFCQHVVTTGEPLLIENAREHPLVRDNLSTTESGIVSYAAVPLSLPGGLVLGALCVVDFEPRAWNAEEVALLESLATFVITEVERRGHSRAELLHVTAVLESAEDAIVGVDPEGMITSWNAGAERLFGYAPEEIQGSPFDLLAPPEERETLRALLARALRGEPIPRLEGERVRRGGSRVYVSVVWTPVRDLGDRVVGVTALLRDVTERIRLEEQLRQAQKMEAIGRLAGGVAHDFNNILTTINANAEFLLADLPDGNPSRDDAQEIRDAAMRAARLTQQLLAFSRKQLRQPRVLDLNEMVRGMDSMLRRLIGEDVDFVTRLAPDLGCVEMDPGQLEQVLLNLVVNARDAMPSGGRLVIETQNVSLGDDGEETYPSLPAGSRGILLAASDTGEGMSREVQERIFEPFFSTKPQGQGTGLGLSTIYGIVKQSGGYIWVYSELGRGTTFRIYLPRTDAAPERAESAPEAGERPRSGTILLAEDEDPVRHATRRVLERIGYRVLPAPDGEAALRIAAEHGEPIDLLVTDVVMPRMNGRELSERLVRLRPGTRVLFLSGYTGEAVVQHGVLDPSVHFLQKPFSPEDLASKIGEVLDAPAP